MKTIVNKRHKHKKVKRQDGENTKISNLPLSKIKSPLEETTIFLLPESAPVEFFR